MLIAQASQQQDGGDAPAPGFGKRTGRTEPAGTIGAVTGERDDLPVLACDVPRDGLSEEGLTGLPGPGRSPVLFHPAEELVAVIGVQPRDRDTRFGQLALRVACVPIPAVQPHGHVHMRANGRFVAAVLEETESGRVAHINAWPGVAVTVVPDPELFDSQFPDPGLRFSEEASADATPLLTRVDRQEIKVASGRTFFGRLDGAEQAADDRRALDGHQPEVSNGRRALPQLDRKLGGVQRIVNECVGAEGLEGGEVTFFGRSDG